jgi:hypothetical protein
MIWELKGSFLYLHDKYRTVKEKCRYIPLYFVAAKRLKCGVHSGGIVPVGESHISESAVSKLQLIFLAPFQVGMIAIVW